MIEGAATTSRSPRGRVRSHAPERLQPETPEPLAPRHKKDIYCRWGRPRRSSPSATASRATQDAFALLSQQRPAAGQRREVRREMSHYRHDADHGQGHGGDVDEGGHVDSGRVQCPDTTPDGLAKLPPAFKEGGTVTAGNAVSSGRRVGGLLMSAERAETSWRAAVGVFAASPSRRASPTRWASGRSSRAEAPPPVGIRTKDIDLVELTRRSPPSGLLPRPLASTRGAHPPMRRDLDRSPLRMSGARLVGTSCTSCVDGRRANGSHDVRRRRDGAAGLVEAT